MTNFTDFEPPRSGSQAFIELFLEFNPDTRMEALYDLLDRMESALKEQIPQAQVMIIPSRSS